MNVYQATSKERRFTAAGKYPGVKSSALHVCFWHLSGARRIKNVAHFKVWFHLVHRGIVLLWAAAWSLTHVIVD